MKTMTCRQMGGSCDAPMQGETADEIMKKGEAHLNEMAGKGDAEHQKAVDMMTAASKDPEASKQWYEKFNKDFEALPQD